MVQAGLDLTAAEQEPLCAAVRAVCRSLRSLMELQWEGARNVSITQIAEAMFAAVQTAGEGPWNTLCHDCMFA